jgi:hypothetical protein
MNDNEVLSRIQQLLEEEHALLQFEAGPAGGRSSAPSGGRWALSGRHSSTTKGGSVTGAPAGVVSSLMDRSSTGEG